MAEHSMSPYWDALKLHQQIKAERSIADVRAENRHLKRENVIWRTLALGALGACAVACWVYVFSGL